MQWLSSVSCLPLQGSSEAAVRQHEVSDHLSGFLRLYVKTSCETVAALDATSLFTLSLEVRIQEPKYFLFKGPVCNI